jgi:hypothetical protein
VDDGRRIDRFNRALNALQSQLEALAEYDFVDQALLSIVRSKLVDTHVVDALRNRFFILAPIADSVAEFLVLPNLQTLLFRETADSLQEDESFGYEFKPGEYSAEVIESPVKFLMDHLKDMLNSWKAGEFAGKSDFFTLWSFQAISSCLRAKN